MQFFCISYRLGLPGILCLSVPFLIISSAPIITGTVIVLSCRIFSISVFKSFYLLLYSSTDMLLPLVTEILIRRHIIIIVIFFFKRVKADRFYLRQQFSMLQHSPQHSLLQVVSIILILNDFLIFERGTFPVFY